jgi:molybdenum cofactor cytidylyltransferase
MNLIKAVRLERKSRTALVGAGGKTAALFQLAREFVSATDGVPGHKPISRVFVSATTHLATVQLEKADHYFIVRESRQLDGIEDRLPEGIVLFIGPPEEQERLAGLEPALLERLALMAERLDAPLLIEADGSRRKPFKAPAPHEPVIPDWVDSVIVSAGLLALGKPLSAEWVHRPERVSALSGLTLGDLVSLDTYQRVLEHPQGGLKGIPGGARRVVLLNQADTPELQAAGSCLSERLLESYHAALVAALAPGELAGEFPSQVEPGVAAVHERVAGIILAAGASLRMGKLKQTLSWKNEALVRHVARTALDSGLKPVLVVTGYAAGQVQAALEGLNVCLVHNPDWAEGQSSSVKAGLRCLPEGTGAAMFLLADQPQTPARLVRSLVELHSRTLAPLAAPQIQGQRANPVLFDKAVFPDLLKLSGDIGGRVLFSHYPVAWLPWHDLASTLDVDTPEDYQRLLELP